MYRFILTILLATTLLASPSLAAIKGLNQGKAAFDQGHYQQALNYLLISFPTSRPIHRSTSCWAAAISNWDAMKMQ